MKELGKAICLMREGAVPHVDRENGVTTSALGAIKVTGDQEGRGVYRLVEQVSHVKGELNVTHIITQETAGGKKPVRGIKMVNGEVVETVGFEINTEDDRVAAAQRLLKGLLSSDKRLLISDKG